MKTTTLHTVKLPATTGTQTIAAAKDVFTGWIDSDFKNWGLDKEGEKMSAITLEVAEMTENATFAQLFTQPDKMALSQEQIIEFCKTHKDKLHPDWYTFFLFKVGEKFFVADVYSDGLSVDVSPLSLDDVWLAERRHRFVIPQLTPSTLESETLGHSETLTLESAIKMVKEAGYQVSKII